jgi:hypothetical protein
LVTLPKPEDRFEHIKRFNPGEEAVVEEPVNMPIGGSGGSAQVKNWSPLEIKVKTSSPSPAFLVLSEVYYPPYWSADIDGQKAKIYPTNHLLRGLAVPAGEHTVTFKCISFSYKAGKLVHNIASVGILLMIVCGILPTIRGFITKRRG